MMPKSDYDNYEPRSESFLDDTVHPEAVLSFTPSSEKDESVLLSATAHAKTKPEHVRNNLVPRPSNTKVTHTHTHTHKMVRKHEFRAAHMDSPLCSNRQEYSTIVAATKCRHAAQRIRIHKLHYF